MTVMTAFFVLNKDIMFENSISLESLLETHERPFIIIDNTLTIVGLNKAWLVVAPYLPPINKN